MRGDRRLFDFFMARRINVHYISKRKVELHKDGEVYFNNVHANAMSYLRSGYHMIGETEDLRYIKDVLMSRGVVNTPPVYYSGEGGCCEVQ